MNSAVERAINYIWERYDEPLSLTDIARSAILSRFHLSRIFKDATGVPPGRYLSAVRIYQAKRMLSTTSMKVTDISFAVGFSSLGSFTNHFTDSVGFSPSRFRRFSQQDAYTAPDEMLAPKGAWGSASESGTVVGAARLPESYSAVRLYLGAFDSPIVQCRPAASFTADIASPAKPFLFRLSKVPEGDWFIHAVAVADSADPEPWSTRKLLVSDQTLVRVGTDGTAHAEICLRPRRPTDLPILLALPDLEPEPEDIALPAARTLPSVYDRAAG